MKEIVEAFVTRIKSPVFGYFFLSWFGFNWKKVILLLFSNELIEKRVEIFENSINFFDALVYPLGLAIVIAVIYPWINYIFLIISSKPIQLRNNIQAETENKLLLRKAELEDARSKYLSAREKDLIERAKTDDSISNIANEEIREEVQRQINELRSEVQGNVSNKNDGVNVSKENSSWVVQRRKNDKGSTVHKTQNEAYEHAKNLLKENGGGELNLYDESGELRRQEIIKSKNYSNS